MVVPSPAVSISGPGRERSDAAHGMQIDKDEIEQVVRVRRR